ncbi:nuclear transport factor 2 family protein [Rhizobium sp. BK251]|uniref:nuclear transport factor 2 family protein n=1 Tax=Rhizobium sp. BK251 TaxID=2512125 RepID=UPI0010429738|nr:nuclear transport factor 2 family protein [Rhizobium sp. BK251]TCL62913.1 hypothetical protein EV286_11819 [Rhizobium sp. BK251]
MKELIATAAIAGLLTLPITETGSATQFPITAETSSAAPETVKFFNEYFSAKSRHDASATMEYFSPNLLTYTDAVLGWPLDGFDSLKSVFAEAMPKWGSGQSYPFRIIGGPDSAVVAFIDTPELFGGEIRLLGAVDFQDGKIVRWVDYWDSTGFPTEAYHAMRTPPEKFPTDLKERSISDNAAPEIVKTAETLQQSLSKGDPRPLDELLSYDVVYEDLALRTQLLGRDAVVRYLNRVSQVAPFAKDSVLLHVVGGKNGGGYEWLGKDIRGITAIELDVAGKVARITHAYDGRLLSPDRHREFVGLSAEQQ